MPCLVDEFTRECLAIRAARRFAPTDVIETLAELEPQRGAPGSLTRNEWPCLKGVLFLVC